MSSVRKKVTGILFQEITLNPKCVGGLDRFALSFCIICLSCCLYVCMCEYLCVCVCVQSITGHAGDQGRVSFSLVQFAQDETVMSQLLIHTDMKRRENRST